jgi:hypothetical protein
MSIVNPYITTDLNELQNLHIMFKKFITSESQQKKNISIITFSGKRDYIINNKVYPLTWNSMKLLSSDKTHYFLLEHYEKLRKIIVDSLLYIVIKNLTDCSNNEVRFNKCSSIALGSSSITSDYDINLLSDNPIINSKIIKDFNKLFFKMFGDDSSSVFDTNIYGIGFLNKKKYMIPVEVREQSVIAFVKLISTEEKYGIDIIQDFNIKNRFFNKMYLEANDFYISYVEKEVGEDKYTKTLELIQDVLGEGNDLSILEEMSMKDQEKIQSFISLANMYANETYFTQGAFLHVVSRLQSDESIELSSTDYINSMFENFFEVNKEYAIYKNSLNVDLFLKSSYKYLYRFYDAAKEAGLLIDYETYEIFKDLDRFRKGNKENPDVKKKLEKVQKNLDIILGIETNLSNNRELKELHENLNSNTQKSTNLSINIGYNVEIKKYMESFWEIFMKLYKESLLILPSPRTSMDSINKSSLKRRKTSYTKVMDKVDPIKSSNSDENMAKLRRQKIYKSIKELNV